MSKLKQVLIPSIALFVICAVVSLALAGTNFITKDTIKKSEQTALQNSLSIAVPNADEFKEMHIQNNVYYTALKDNSPIAYVIETKAKGYGGDITALTAISKDGKLLKVTVTDASNETTGIGTKVTESEFLDGFTGSPDNVDGVTGATYSSNGVKQAVKNAFEIFEKIGGEK